MELDHVELDPMAIDSADSDPVELRAISFGVGSCGVTVDLAMLFGPVELAPAELDPRELDPSSSIIY